MKLICSFHLHELIFVLEFFKFSGPLWQRIIITCVSIPKWIRVGEFVYPFFDAAAEENLQWIIFHFLSWNRFSEKPKWLVLLWWENTFDTLKRYIYLYSLEIHSENFLYRNTTIFRKATLFIFISKIFEDCLRFVVLRFFLLDVFCFAPEAKRSARIQCNQT